jgi:hypothetical protein
MVEIRVKPLNWHLMGHRVWYSKAGGHTYMVTLRPYLDEYHIDAGGSFPTLEEAKEACHKIYEENILMCLQD